MAKTRTKQEFSFPEGSVLFHFNRVPVVVQPGFWPLPVLVTIVAGTGNMGRIMEQ